MAQPHSMTQAAAIALARRGYHVIPLLPNSKAAVDKNWNKTRFSIDVVEDRWGNDPDYNVGLLTGTEIAPSTFLIAVDIDQDDEALINNIRYALPDAPAKKGKKGATFFARSSIPHKKKQFKRKGEGKAIVEILALGQQTVVPPSIHPETREPYEWITAPLWEFDPQELPPWDEHLLNEVQTAVRYPEAKWFGINVMEPGGYHDACQLAAASMVYFHQPEDWIVRRILRAMKVKDQEHGHEGRDYDKEERVNIPEWVKSSLEKSFNEQAADDESPFVTWAKWLRDEWNGGGNIYRRSGQMLIYEDGYWKAYEPLEFRAFLASPRCGDTKIMGLGNKNWVELTHTCFALFPVFPSKPPYRRVALLNGTYDLDDGTLSAHSRDDFLISKLDFEYDPEATCPIYERVVNETFEQPDNPEDAVKMLACYEEFVAMTLFECHDYHKFLVLEGTTRSGKGVLSKIADMLHADEAVCSVQAHDLNKESSRAQMLNKLINIVNETSTVNAVADEYLKTIVAGEKVEVRFLYHGSFSAILPTRIMIATNEPLKTRDSSGAITERMLVLKCDNHVPIEKRDVRLPAKLRAERAGIFNRIARAWPRLRERGAFELPQSSLEMLENFEESNNQVLMWACERTHEGKHYKNPEYQIPDKATGATPIGTLYEDYKTWVEMNGLGKMSIITFGMKLTQTSINGTRMGSTMMRVGVGGSPARVRALSLIANPRY